MKWDDIKSAAKRAKDDTDFKKINDFEMPPHPDYPARQFVDESLYDGNADAEGPADTYYEEAAPLTQYPRPKADPDAIPVKVVEEKSNGEIIAVSQTVYVPSVGTYTTPTAGVRPVRIYAYDPRVRRVTLPVLPTGKGSWATYTFLWFVITAPNQGQPTQDDVLRGSLSVNASSNASPVVVDNPGDIWALYSEGTANTQVPYTFIVERELYVERS